MESPIYRSTLNIKQYQIKIEIYHDDMGHPLEYDDSATEINYNPLPINAAWCDEESPFDYTDFAIDNFYHNAYFMVDSKNWHDKKRYFVLRDSIEETRDYFSKIGYAKHDAWLKALESLKSQARYIQAWFSDQWHFVGVIVEVTETMTDESGLIWSREIANDHNALWGVEWSSFAPWDREIIDNSNQFKRIIPDLLPEHITLIDSQLDDLWVNLE